MFERKPLIIKEEGPAIQGQGLFQPSEELPQKDNNPPVIFPKRKPFKSKLPIDPVPPPNTASPPQIPLTRSNP